MKILLFSVLLAFTLVSCSQQGGEAKVANSGHAKFKTSAHCANCKKTIETALTKVKGVKTATLNLDDKVATVDYDPEQSNPEALKTAIVEAGYVATEMP
jgi:copper chaperone CopZ